MLAVFASSAHSCFPATQELCKDPFSGDAPPSSMDSTAFFIGGMMKTCMDTLKI